MIYFVVNRFQIGKLKEIVREIDRSRSVTLFTSADNANEKINITTPIAILYPYNPASFCPYI